MKRCCVAAVVMAVFAFGAAADEPAAREIVYPLYTVTVEEGTTNRLYDSTVSVLSEADGTAQNIAFATLTETEGALTTGTFQKLGRGFLISSTNMITFTGEIWIDEGAILLDWSGELGPKNSTAGAVRIANGASLGLAADTMTSQAMNIFNTIYLSGTGLNGVGAIFHVADCGGDYMRAAFKGGFVFEGDALFGTNKDDMGDNGGITYQLNGHTLTFDIRKGYVTSGSKFQPGHVVFARGSYYPQSKIYFYGGPTNTLTFKSGTKFSGYHTSTITSPWTLVLEDNTTISFGGTAANAEKYWESLTYDNWDGPVNLLGKATVTASSNGDAQYLFPFTVGGCCMGQVGST